MVSRMPSLVGLCQDNLPQIANYVNSAQRRLLYAKEARDEGWYGTYAEVVFNVSQTEPYITLPREIARLEAIDVCNKPVRIQNQFYEYLTFGDGRMPKLACWQGQPGLNTQGYTRNNAVTFVEMTNAPQFITVYGTDAQDVTGLKRILIQGLDDLGNTIYSQDIGNQIEGTFLTLTSPSITTSMSLSALTGIQKDITMGPVRIYQHDPATGSEVLLLTMQPGETTAQYRRYYLHRLPQNCCSPPSGSTGILTECSTTPVQVTALAKLDLIPAVVPTDWLLIQNLESIIEECQAVRYSEMDSASAKQMASERHRQAIGMLMGEQAHYMGLNQPAVRFSPFGSARLKNQRIGNIV